MHAVVTFYLHACQISFTMRISSPLNLADQSIDGGRLLFETFSISNTQFLCLFASARNE